MNVVRSAIAECLAPTADTSGRNLVASMARFVQADPQNAWFQVGLGLAHLRRGAPAVAVETFSQSAVAHWIPGHYHMALAFHTQGDLARGANISSGASAVSRALAKDILLDTHPALPSNVQGTRFGGVVAHGWWEVVAAQIARAEASAAIEGQPRPDPWKHLLAARGFGLLGDAERATPSSRWLSRPPGMIPKCGS